METESYLKQIFRDADVYVTAVENDECEKVVCGACAKPISGTAFKHRYSDLFFHILCLNEPTHYKALMLHFGNEHDHLIFTEEVKNEVKKGVVCFGCEKPIFGPGYKCSTVECNLLLHQSCAKPPPTIQQHPFHRIHTLSLGRPKRKFCNACGKSCNKYPFYRCNECDFNLDFACATHSPINNTNNCQHDFITFFKQIQFTCEACGEQGKELALQCRICQLLIHGKCARFSGIIWITRHYHSLTLTYSLGQVIENYRQAKNIFCKLCYHEVKTEYAAYYCRKCNYVAHLACAFKYEESANLKSMLEDSVDLEVGGARKIQHFSHQHELELKLTNDDKCDGCMELISTPFYDCTQCNFILHERCALLPRSKRHQFHPHKLTLFSRASYSGGLFTCDVCKHLRGGFAYGCGMCDFIIDLQCSLISEFLKHEGHQHSLFLAKYNGRCHACNFTSYDKPGMFVCIYCDFALGFECATLPLVARHKDDGHILKLTYSAEAHREKYYCLICQKERDPKQWFYYCAKCDFSAHSQCVLEKYPYIKFGSTFTSRYHKQHPLTFVPKTESSPPCDSCGKTFDGLALECPQCKFNVHHECLWKVGGLEVKNQHSIGKEGIS